MKLFLAHLQSVISTISILLKNHLHDKKSCLPLQPANKEIKAAMAYKTKKCGSQKIKNKKFGNLKKVLTFAVQKGKQKLKAIFG